MSQRDKQISITQCNEGQRTEKLDQVAIEEPLEIRVVSGPEEKRRGKAVSITMRTPGNDEELALGFLFTEGILTSNQQIKQVEVLAQGQELANTIRVELTYDTEFDVQKLQRNFYMTSSCGVCGKASLEALRSQEFSPVQNEFRIQGSVVSKLPAILREHQDAFLRTGGIHAAGLFDRDGNLLILREDVGRHNALDKLIGGRLQDGHLPANDQALVVSGRASFELLQKSLAAGISVFIAVGAPSSLAVELANAFNITLVGFASAKRFHVYANPRRILLGE